ncbi:MAG: hypothetical protein ING46_14740, partial [Rubrivivax sp.]|nr:hypothetical protein [Rubrivivax sp.]
MHPRLRTLAFLATVVAAGCGGGSGDAAPAPPPVAPPPPAAPYPTGLSDQSLTVAGVARQYRVHVPAGL